MWPPYKIDKELTGLFVLTNFPFDKSDCLNESSLIHSSLYPVKISTQVNESTDRLTRTDRSVDPLRGYKIQCDWTNPK